MKWKVGQICSYITLIPLYFCYTKQQGLLRDLSRLDMKDNRRGCCNRAASVDGLPMKRGKMIAESEMVKSC